LSCKSRSDSTPSMAGVGLGRAGMIGAVDLDDLAGLEVGAADR
jgi:hypothetical protein